MYAMSSDSGPGSYGPNGHEIHPGGFRRFDYFDRQRFRCHCAVGFSVT